MARICKIEEAMLMTHHFPTDPVEFRQLRHQTKNALQRILMQVLEAPELSGSRAERRLADDIARRIELSANVSDALFGFTKRPAPLPLRLRSLSESLFGLYTDGTQTIRLQVVVADSASMSHRRQDTIVRMVHELVVNALKHGMHMRLVGHISIRIDTRADGTLLLVVANDGWQINAGSSLGDGLGIVRELAQAEGGDMRIITRPHSTFEIRLPGESEDPADWRSVSASAAESH
jgi:two-component sensor histidine kinase